MSLLLRRVAVVSLAALALTAGGTAAASATAVPAPAFGSPGPDGFGGRHQQPLHFGPFEIPRSGSISGGFSWGMGH
ncbi:hypothetical protein [Streptomyces sp. AC555_RSS877]|uniref:hypothetical protein n=1 Tax=Streptomyces sp. AC555_RSS877 TaxID=2823688 RepID=UPI001C25D451|nr:hypothetical protein [Streptomyces sp. AC555_RSS877]